MIKRLLQLITDRLRHWKLFRSLSVTKRHRPQKLSRFRPATSHLSTDITYSRPRSEVVAALNRILKHGRTDRFERTAAQSPNLEALAAELSSETERSDLVKSVADSAYLCECQGRLEEAEHLYQQAVTLSIRCFGEAHLEITPHLNDLAKFYYSQQRYTEAQPLLEKTILIQQQYQSICHPDKGEALYQLANIYRYLENYGKAESLYQQSLFVFRQALGLDHARTQSVHNELMQMLATVIASGQFESLIADLPPLELDTLSDTYSWAKPDWIKGTQPEGNYSWIKLHSPSEDEPDSQ